MVVEFGAAVVVVVVVVFPSSPPEAAWQLSTSAKHCEVSRLNDPPVKMQVPQLRRDDAPQRSLARRHGMLPQAASHAALAMSSDDGDVPRSPGGTVSSCRVPLLSVPFDGNLGDVSAPCIKPRRLRFLAAPSLDDESFALERTHELSGARGHHHAREDTSASESKSAHDSHVAYR